MRLAGKVAIVTGACQQLQELGRRLHRGLPRKVPRSS